MARNYERATVEAQTKLRETMTDTQRQRAEFLDKMMGVKSAKDVLVKNNAEPVDKEEPSGGMVVDPVTGVPVTGDEFPPEPVDGFEQDVTEDAPEQDEEKTAPMKAISTEEMEKYSLNPEEREARIREVTEELFEMKRREAIQGANGMAGKVFQSIKHGMGRAIMLGKLGQQAEEIVNQQEQATKLAMAEHFRGVENAEAILEQAGWNGAKLAMGPEQLEKMERTKRSFLSKFAEFTGRNGKGMAAGMAVEAATGAGIGWAVRRAVKNGTKNAVIAALGNSLGSTMAAGGVGGAIVGAMTGGIRGRRKGEDEMAAEKRGQSMTGGDSTSEVLARRFSERFGAIEGAPEDLAEQDVAGIRAKLAEFANGIEGNDKLSKSEKRYWKKELNKFNGEIDRTYAGMRNAGKITAELDAFFDENGAVKAEMLEDGHFSVEAMKKLAEAVNLRDMQKEGYFVLTFGGGEMKQEGETQMDYQKRTMITMNQELADFYIAVARLEGAMKNVGAKGEGDEVLSGEEFDKVVARQVLANRSGIIGENGENGTIKAINRTRKGAMLKGAALGGLRGGIIGAAAAGASRVARDMIMNGITEEATNGGNGNEAVTTSSGEREIGHGLTLKDTDGDGIEDQLTGPDGKTYDLVEETTGAVRPEAREVLEQNGLRIDYDYESGSIEAARGAMSIEDYAGSHGAIAFNANGENLNEVRLDGLHTEMDGDSQVYYVWNVVGSGRGDVNDMEVMFTPSGTTGGVQFVEEIDNGQIRIPADSTLGASLFHSNGGGNGSSATFMGSMAQVVERTEGSNYTVFGQASGNGVDHITFVDHVPETVRIQIYDENGVEQFVQENHVASAAALSPGI